VNDFDARARRVVAEHIFEDLLSGSVRQGLDTTGNGIELAGDATVSLVDYGVLKERARIVRMLVADAGDWHEGLDVCESGCCHCPAIDLIEGETK
jgi:hypothetical protein